MQGVRAPQPSGTNSPSSSSHAYPSGCAIESHERCATARVARGDPAALTGPYRPARARPARARPWRRGSPGPIPNPEVKPAIAESTAASGCGRIGRRARGGRFGMRRPRPPREAGPSRVLGGSAPLGGAWRSVSGVLRFIPPGSWIAKPSSNPSPALFALFFLPLSTASLFLAFRMRRSAVGTTRLLYMLTTCMLKEYRCY